MKKAYIYINYNYKSVVVIKSYLEIVQHSLEDIGYSCDFVRSLDGIDKKDLIVFPLGLDAYKFYHKGFHNYILWVQGVTSEESYLKHKSNIRRVILNYVDIFAMKRAKAILYVSKPLRKYYEKVGRTSFKEKSYIMPCFNETLDYLDLSHKDYNKFRFAYVGSLSVWQCFDETLDIYKQIEDEVNEASIKILTFQEDEAEEKVAEKGIKNYEIKSVPQEQVREELKDISYGFVIRDNNIVNRVATPTKLSSYLSAGVLPIYSTCLKDFYQNTNGLEIALPLDCEDTSVEKIIQYVLTDKNKNNITNNIKKLFSSYYSSDFHEMKLKELLTSLV